MADDLLAKERDAKFKIWLQNKSIKDKAFEYLSRLESDRATEEDSLVETAISLRAVDRLLGNDESGRPAGEDQPPAAGGEKDKMASSGTKKTLKSAWFRWAMEYHTFSMIHLTEADVSTLSGAVKEFLFSEADIVASSGNYGAELERASKVKNILPSLKYFFPPVPKPGERPKPLTADQKAQNQIYMREARKLWRKAGEELNSRVVEYVARALKGKKAGGGDDGGPAMERESKSKADAEYNGGGGDSTYDTPDERLAKAKRYESQCLHELSLKQMKKWLEEDEDAKTNRENENAMEKLKQAKQSHEQFVKKKDSLRIRMPANLTALPIPSMGYGKDMSAVRANPKGVASTVDMMAGLGLKFVHATNRGRKGGGAGDLERSRQKLLDVGYVDKRNFDEEDSNLYEKEKRENKVIREREEFAAKQKEDTAKAYEEWLKQKEMRDAAVKCLGLIPKPSLTAIPQHDDPRGSTAAAGGRRSSSISNYNNNNNTLAGGAGTSMLTGNSGSTNNSLLTVNNAGANRALVRHIVDVGKAMKRVDRTTFAEWARWCDGVLSTNNAQTLWDYFPPMSCDVHCASYSQVRDTFLKLLRPGMDFRQTFVDYVEKHVLARRIAKFKDEKDYYRLREEAVLEVDEELEALRKEWVSEVALSKADMAKLLLTMGISMKETEMRALIDAFDANGDGVITIAEFLDFTGPKRDKRSGNSVVMSQRCCWMTTCKITGMPGAYSVSAPTKRALRAASAAAAEGESKEGAADETGSRSSAAGREMHAKSMSASVTSLVSTSGGGNHVVVRQLANGEKRMCVEVKDRKRREELLRKFGLLSAGVDGDNTAAGGAGGKMGTIREESNRKRQADNDEYGDDFEDGGDKDEYDNDFDDDEGGGDTQHGAKNTTSNSGDGGGGANSKNPNACDYSHWGFEARKSGLKFLTDITKDAREEETLKVLLANGSPPAPPKMWVQNEATLDTKSLNRSSQQRHRRRNNNNNDDNDDDHDEEGMGPELGPESTELTVFWGPHKGDLVSFYSLEYGGAVGATKSKDVKYNEIFRDPPEAGQDRPFDFSYTMSNLTPGASYRFRVRAFNGFGAGEYTYKTFTTITAPPNQPRIIRTAADCVTLRWTFSAGFFRRLEELKRIFVLADSDKSGNVSREELTAVLDDRASGSPDLKNFLQKVAGSLGLDVSQGYDALFDMIEGDDDGGLSWEEFETFFMAAGWGNAGSSGGGGAGGLMGNTQSMAQTQSTMRGAAGPQGAGVTITPGDINYVVERCESEIDDKYVEVLRTTLGYGTITRLEPGKSYRFRVHSLNADGVAGGYSPTVTVHTLLETPLAPTAPVKFIQSRKVALYWKSRNLVTASRSKAFTDRMLGEWAGSHGDDEGGVSIRAAFDKYDRDHSNDIDSAELQAVLEDLGVDASEERLQEAFDKLDRNGDGVISYEEFSKWWRRDSVSFTLKRSEEVPPSAKPLHAALDNGKGRSKDRARSATRGRRSTGIGTGLSAVPEDASIGGGRSVSRGGARPNSATSVAGSATAGGSVHSSASHQQQLQQQQQRQQVAMPIVSYRGDKTRTEIMGLTPNHLYHFKLRYVGSRSNSMLSPPLVLMTAPLPTSTPSLIELTSSTVRVKWYPSQFGAYKFVVHMRTGDGSNYSNTASNRTLNYSATSATSSSGLSSAARKVSTGLSGVDTGEDGWVVVYNGQENVCTCTSLASNTDYQVRVFAVNMQGTMSEASEIVTFSTLQRSEKDILTPKNAGACFTIECTGDICVGDTILITERLFLKSKQSSVPFANAEGVNVSGIGGGGGGGGSVRNSMQSHGGGASRAATTTAGASKNNTNKNKTMAGAIAAGAANARTGQMLNLSSSVTSLNGDGVSITAQRGPYLGERTIAAYVSRDNYRTIRDGLHKSGIEPRDSKKFGQHRKLWLEVVWQRTSDEACKPYDLKSGEVLERMQGHLEQFEVFRCRWKQESQRRPLQEEWKSMLECFLSYEL